MEIDELFSHLDQYRGPFPNHLVEEIIARREEVIPAFLEMLEDIDRNPGPWAADERRMVHIYAMYLLALFRETRAYPLLVKIFTRPGAFSYDLVGDVVTQSLGSILASVSGGDPAGMTTLIENEEVNEWVRGQALDALVKLVLSGQYGRDEVMTYFLQLFRKFKREPSELWNSLANACADLWPHEALYELNHAYKDGLIYPGNINWRSIERALALGKEGA